MEFPNAPNVACNMNYPTDFSYCDRYNNKGSTGEMDGGKTDPNSTACSMWLSSTLIFLLCGSIS